jgi:hypothetical protein
MDNNARVRIQVDDSKIRALKQSAAELYTKLSEQAKAQARDLRDANRYIEEQIRLIERRNEAATRSRRAEIEYDKRTGRLAGRSYESAVRGIDQRAFADQERVRALRGLMDIEFGPRARAMEQFGDISRTAALGGGNVSGGIEEGIRRREIASRRAFAMQENQLRSRYEQGYLTRDQYGRGLRDLRAEQRQDALLVKLLREIADNTKNDARKSAEELVKRLGVRSREDATRWIADLEGKRTGTAADIMRRQEAASILRERYGVGTSTRGDGGGILSMLSGGGIRGAISTFAPSMLALAVAKLAWNGVQRVGEIQSSGRDIAAMNPGLDLNDVWSMSLDRGRRGVALGLSGIDFLRYRAGYQRASGRLISADEALGNFAQQRALGLSDEQYNQMLALGRFNRGRSAQGAISALENTTMRRFGNLSLLPEIIETYQRAAQNILNVRGDFNQNAVAGVIQGLSVGTGAQGAQLNRIVGGLQNIGNNGNPLAMAMAYRAARLTNPNIDVWGASKLIEDPLSNTDFLRTYLQQIQQGAGGGSSAKFLAKAILPGLSFDDIDKLFGARGDRDFDKIIGEIRTGRRKDYEPRAKDLTTTYEKFVSDLELVKDEAIDTAKKISEGARTEAEARQRMAKKFEDLLDRADNTIDKINYSLNLYNMMNPYGAN